MPISKSARYKKTVFNLAWRIAYLVAFIFIASALAAYARGYKFNFDQNTLERTGAISLQGSLRGIQVYLGANEVSDRLPYYINDLTPHNLYALKITKDGFYEWRAEAIIDPEQIRQFGPIKLWPNKVTPLQSEAVNNIDLCLENLPAKSQELIIDGGELKSGTKLITRLSSPIVDACWYPDSYHIAYVTGKSIQMIEDVGTNDTTLYTAGEEISKVSVATNGHTVYYLTKSNKWFKIELP